MSIPCKENYICIKNKLDFQKIHASFNFDYVFDDHIQQIDLYSISIVPLLDLFLNVNKQNKIGHSLSLARCIGQSLKNLLTNDKLNLVPKRAFKDFSSQSPTSK